MAKKTPPLRDSPMERTVTKSTRLPDEIEKKLQAEAKAESRTVSNMIAKILIERYEDKK